MVRVWLLPLLLTLAGAAIAVEEAASGVPVGAALSAIMFLALAFVVSPLIFPGTGPVVAGRPVVYWRPGCSYCMRLRLRLGRTARKATWVNIWRDPAAAAAVRAITGGDETVPTVVLADGAHVNPDPAWLRTQLRAASK